MPPCARSWTCWIARSRSSTYSRRIWRWPVLRIRRAWAVLQTRKGIGNSDRSDGHPNSEPRFAARVPARRGSFDAYAWPDSQARVAGCDEARSGIGEAGFEWATKPRSTSSSRSSRILHLEPSKPRLLSCGFGATSSAWTVIGTLVGAWLSNRSAMKRLRLEHEKSKPAGATRAPCRAASPRMPIITSRPVEGSGISVDEAARDPKFTGHAAVVAEREVDRIAHTSVPVSVPERTEIGPSPTGFPFTSKFRPADLDAGRAERKEIRAHGAAEDKDTRIAAN